MLTNEERSDEYRFKGTVKKAKEKSLNAKNNGERPSAAQQWPKARPRSKATQGRTTESCGA